VKFGRSITVVMFGAEHIKVTGNTHTKWSLMELKIGTSTLGEA
jgi:hypothetical protein